MPRSVQWRRTSSDACCWHQTQAMDTETTIYILRQLGPSGFILKEEGERKTVKVFLGDPHTCTCPTYKKERDLCKHICWLLLRKFRLSVNDPLSWQLGLVEMEINEIIRGRVTAEQTRTRPVQKEKEEVKSADGRSMVQQRDIDEEDVCPICQDEFMNKKLPVTFCKFGCGNSVHIKCMKVWAEHQQKTTTDGSIKCPMCREDFGPIELLKAEARNAGGVADPPPGIRLDRHVGLACGHCSKAPIEGKCYRCTVCPTFHMCQRCFNLPVHTHHQFQFRQKRNQRWRSAIRTLGSSLPPAIVNELQHRDITEEDYELLHQIERNNQEELSTLSEDALASLPIETVRNGSNLLAPGSQCRVCLRGFSVGQYVRKLPCKHKFHKDCIDSWLLHSHPNCPIDGIVVVRTSTVRSHRSASDQPQDNTSNNESTHSNAAGLTLTAMGIPVSASRTRDRQVQGRLHTRRPPHAMNRGHGGHGGQVHGDMQLHLSGTALSGGDDITYPSESQPVDVPGRRLLQQATQLRERLARRLQAANIEPTDSDITPADLISFLAMGSSPFGQQGDGSDVRGTSAASTLSAVSDSGGHHRRGRETGIRSRHVQEPTTLRRRTASLDRSGVPSISSVRRGSRDLFLGNDPQQQSAMSEGIGPSHSAQPLRGRPPRVFKPTLRHQGHRPPSGRNSRQGQGQGTRQLSLQGSGIDGSEDN